MTRDASEVARRRLAGVALRPASLSILLHQPLEIPIAAQASALDMLGNEPSAEQRMSQTSHQQLLVRLNQQSEEKWE